MADPTPTRDSSTRQALQQHLDDASVQLENAQRRLRDGADPADLVDDTRALRRHASQAFTSAAYARSLRPVAADRA